MEVLDVLENNKFYRNLSPFCEPQLGRRALPRKREVILRDTGVL